MEGRPHTPVHTPPPFARTLRAYNARTMRAQFFLSPVTDSPYGNHAGARSGVLMKVTRIKGFADVGPDEAKVWQRIEGAAAQVFASYNFKEIRIPVLEKSELFSRSLGETTDVIEKEMYTFPDRDAGATLLSLRPEGTAGVVRAYVEGNLYQSEPLRKLWYLGPMFRRERPQKGRLRQFHQIGAEVFGRTDPFADAELLLLLRDLWAELGVAGTVLEVNSIGCAECRPVYRAALVTFLEGRREELCADCDRRLENNPLRVLDCKRESCAGIAASAPSILSHLCTDCRQHFETLLDLLKDLRPGPVVNDRLVRGLDYYCRTTFEWKAGAGLGSQNTVAAGGRYDGLVKSLGGPPVAGVGFALGVERLALLLAEGAATEAAAPLLYLAWMGAEARRWMFALAHRLRRRGLRVDMEGDARSLKSQMRRAGKLGARVVLIVGPDEMAKGTAVMRHMTTREQTEVDFADIDDRLAGRPGAPRHQVFG